MFALTHASVIDGSGAEPMRDMTILIDGGKIRQIGSDIALSEDMSRINLRGRTVMPGLIDAHTHIGGNAGFDHPCHAGRIHTYDFAEMREQFLQWGVTTVRDAGSYMPDAVEVRDRINRGELRGPRIITAGRQFQAVGGHPWNSVFFHDEGAGKHALFFIDERTDIEKLVEQQVKEGVDWIKMVCSDDTCPDWPKHLPRLTKEQMRRIADAAHSFGKPVMAHTDGFDDMDLALDAGADTIEHAINNGAQTGWVLTDETLAKLKSGNHWNVPTIIATAKHDGSIQGAEKVMPYVMKGVARMIDAGVQIGVGCDSGIPFVPFGESLHEEMEMLVKAGMTPLQAIAAATGGNAKLLRREQEFGTVREGLCADLVVCEGSPERNIRDTRNIRMVFRNGHAV